MVVTLELKPDLEKKLMERARSQGKGLDKYLADMIENDARDFRSIDEILAPFRDEFDGMEISDVEFEHFVEEIREDIHR